MYKAELVSRAVERNSSPPTNLPTTSELPPLLPQQSQNPADIPVISPPGLLRRRASMSAIMPCPKSSPSAAHHNRLDKRLAPALLTSRSRQSVTPHFSIYYKILAYRFIIRVGKIVNSQSVHLRKAQPESYQPTQFGLTFSIYLPQFFRRGLGLALCIFQIMLVSGTRNTPRCSLGFVKTVSADAEVFQCARAGLNENVKRLLSLRQATAKDTTIFGITLLHSASKSGNIELVRLLIQEGADVNAQDEDGESPLHGALARSNNYDTVRILVENGADLFTQAVDGKTPLHGIFNDTISQVLMKDEWLENISPDSEAMSITHYLAWSSTSTLAIFQRGRLYDDADLLSTDRLGRTCLHFAASRGNVGVFSYLVGQVSIEDVEKKDIQGRTPLHYAVQSSRAAEVIDRIVEKGCNIYVVDEAGRTALHWAARWNNFKAVKKLTAITDGATTLVQSDRNGRMPSAEVSQKRASALYKYLKDLESSIELSASGQPKIALGLPRHSKVGYFVDSTKCSLVVLESVGILILILMMIFLGIPD